MVYLFFGLTIVSAILTGCFVTDLGHCVQAGDNDPNIRPAAISGIVTIALAVMTFYMIVKLTGAA